MFPNTDYLQAGLALRTFGICIVMFGLVCAGSAAAQSVAANNIAYTYNAKGERITKTVDGVTTRFTYDERGHLISEVSPAGSRAYVYIGDTLVSTVDTPVSPASPATVSYVVADHTGNPRVVNNDAGTVVWQNPYKGNAWGDRPVSANGYALNVRSVGSYYDTETSLIYNLNRYYDPNAGRFMRADPLGLVGGISPYEAVSSNPLNRLDPDGLRDIFVGGAADASSEIVKTYYAKYNKTHPNSMYYSWKHLDDIVKDINDTAKNTPDDPINIIGHSYGGDTAAAAALQVCGKVNLLITVDPVSRFSSRDLQALKGSVGTWIDVNAQGGSAFQFDNFVAGWGGSWDAGPNGIADSYIQNHFTSHGDFQQMMNASGPGINSPAQVLGGAPLVNPPFVNR